jgi:FkbM family methyltransferase
MRIIRRIHNVALELSCRGRGIEWTINGIRYRVDPRHRHRLAHAYEDTVARVLAERVRPGELCLNVGANVGAYVLQFAHWSAPTGRIIAFEPNPAALGVLRRHIRMNNLEHRVIAVPVAIADQVTTATLYVMDADGMARLGAPNFLLGARTTPLPVSVTTLDSYCEARDLEPDWLIVDIEGLEIAALRGCARLIKRVPHLQMIIEMHPSVWPASGTSRREAEALLAAFGLRAESLTGQVDPFAQHGQVLLTRQ